VLLQYFPNPTNVEGSNLKTGPPRRMRPEKARAPKETGSLIGLDYWSINWAGFRRDASPGRAILRLDDDLDFSRFLDVFLQEFKIWRNTFSIESLCKKVEKSLFGYQVLVAFCLDPLEHLLSLKPRNVNV